MNQSIIKNLYNEVLSKDCGSSRRKFDLHIHTPLSDDFTSSKELNGDNKYFSILDKAIEENLEIIAITDHNTFCGYNIIRNIMNPKNDRPNLYKKNY